MPFHTFGELWLDFVQSLHETLGEGVARGGDEGAARQRFNGGGDVNLRCAEGALADLDVEVAQKLCGVFDVGPTDDELHEAFVLKVVIEEEIAAEGTTGFSDVGVDAVVHQDFSTPLFCHLVVFPPETGIAGGTTG